MVLPLILAGLLAAPASPSQANSIAGVWEGTYHSAKGDQEIALLILPRGPARLAGMVSIEGSEFGPIENGAVRGDSVSFQASKYPFAGLVSGRTLALRLFVPHGATHDFMLRYSSPDTIRLPAFLREPQALPQATIARERAPDSVYAAHAVPDEAPSGGAPYLQHGTLLLVGGGPTQPDVQSRFCQLAGGDAGTIVVIPTAHMGSEDRAEVDAYSANLGSRFGAAHVTVLHTFSRRVADSPSFVEPLQRASGVWIDGGEASYLLDAYMGTRTERELIRLLDRGGVIGGTSAGALIWGSRCMVFRLQPGVGTFQVTRAENLLIGQAHEPALGVLRNVLISPHFAELEMHPAMAKMVAAYPKLAALGIDEATAVEVHDDSCRVIGRGHVVVYRGRGDKPLLDLTDGARFELRTLTPL
jgi:cyanophycinase